MRWLSEYTSRLRRGPRVGGDAVREQLARATGGSDPFVFDFDDVEVLAFHVEEPLPHILYCTFGLSRVRSSVPVAGTQTELTLRVPADAPVPYAWPAQQLASMVALIRRTGNEIAPGHHMRLRAPVQKDAFIQAFTFVTDPILGLIETQTGLVRFTYAVGLTSQELDAALSWDPVKFTGVLGDYVPLGITDPSRENILGIAEVRERVKQGTLEDGSSISAARAKLLDIDPSGRVDVDTHAAQALLRAARFRLGRGNPFALVCGDAWLRLSPDAPFEVTNTHLQLPATPMLIDEIVATFDAAPGVYRFRTVPITIYVVDTER